MTADKIAIVVVRAGGLRIAKPKTTTNLYYQARSLVPNGYPGRVTLPMNGHDYFVVFARRPSASQDQQVPK